MDRQRWTEQLEAAEEAGLRRRLPAPRAVGEDLIDLGGNDYLGLSRHPRVIAAAREALEVWGAGACASRLLRGNLPPHVELEAELARLKGAEAALVFSSGYAANLGMLSALGEAEDVIFCDRLDHASLVDGARISAATVYFYSHQELERLERQIERTRGEGQRWIVTDGVFSMDGILAPLPELLQIARRHDATLIVDDAHATGVVGPQGRGSLAHFGLASEGVIQMGTLSKAIGSQGGYVAGPQALIDHLVQRSRSLIYSTGLAPASAAAALAATLVFQDELDLNKLLQKRLHELRSGLAQLGWTVLGEAPAPMLAVQVGGNDAALALSRRLQAEGVVAPAIRPPTVPRGTARVRLAPRADMNDRDLERVLEVFGPRNESGI